VPLLIIAIILIAAGIFIAKKSGKRRGGKEVPIYRGKDIIGYRRN